MIGQEYLKFKRVIGQKDRPAIKKLSDDVSSFNKAETINNKSKSIVNLVLSQPKGVAGNSAPPRGTGRPCIQHLLKEQVQKLQKSESSVRDVISSIFGH